MCAIICERREGARAVEGGSSTVVSRRRRPRMCGVGHAVGHVGCCAALAGARARISSSSLSRALYAYSSLKISRAWVTLGAAGQRYLRYMSRCGTLTTSTRCAVASILTVALLLTCVST